MTPLLTRPWPSQHRSNVWNLGTGLRFPLKKTAGTEWGDQVLVVSFLSLSGVVVFFLGGRGCVGHIVCCVFLLSFYLLILIYLFFYAQYVYCLLLYVCVVFLLCFFACFFEYFLFLYIFVLWFVLVLLVVEHVMWSYLVCVNLSWVDFSDFQWLCVFECFFLIDVHAVSLPALWERLCFALFFQPQNVACSH